MEPRSLILSRPFLDPCLPSILSFAIPWYFFVSPYFFQFSRWDQVNRFDIDSRKSRVDRNATYSFTPNFISDRLRTRPIYIAWLSRKLVLIFPDETRGEARINSEGKKNFCEKSFTNLDKYKYLVKNKINSSYDRGRTKKKKMLLRSRIVQENAE